jgi:hypothetical protein
LKSVTRRFKNHFREGIFRWKNKHFFYDFILGVVARRKVVFKKEEKKEAVK